MAHRGTEGRMRVRRNTRSAPMPEPFPVYPHMRTNHAGSDSLNNCATVAAAGFLEPSGASDDSSDRSDHVDEDAVDDFCVRSELDAKEGGRGQVER